jgi:serine/threonine protein kinase
MAEMREAADWGLSPPCWYDAAARLGPMTNKSPPAYGINDPIQVHGNVFRVLSHLGSGGMADVYTVMDHRMKAPCVLKLLKQQSAANDYVRGAFKNEAEVISLISHSNVVRVYGANVTVKGEPYYQMDLLHGMSLADYAAQRRAPALRVYSALDLGIQLMRGLRAVHARGVIHRDIKPHNLIIHRAEDEQFLKIIDFGVMKLLEDPIPAVFVGTPSYAAPEQIMRDMEGTSVDIFSAGIVLFELLTGRRPYEDVTRLPDLLGRAFVEAPPLSVYGGTFPPKLIELVAAMLSLNPGDRPKASEVADVLIPMKRILPGDEEQRFVTAPEGLRDPAANVQHITRADLESPTDPDGQDFSFLAQEYKERERAEILGAPIDGITAVELANTTPGSAPPTRQGGGALGEDEVLPFATTRQGDVSPQAYERLRSIALAKRNDPAKADKPSAVATIERRPSAPPLARRPTDTAPRSEAPPTPLPESLERRQVIRQPAPVAHVGMPVPMATLSPPVARSNAHQGGQPMTRPNVHQGGQNRTVPLPYAASQPAARPEASRPPPPRKLVPGRDELPVVSRRAWYSMGGHWLAIAAGVALAVALLGALVWKVRQ